MFSFSSNIQPTITQTQSSTTAAAVITSLIRHHHHSHPHQSCFSPFPSHHPRRRLSIRAIDAAQPYDYVAHHFEPSTKLKIAIVGFGNFGQFLAKAFVRQGHTVYAYSRSNYHSAAEAIGAAFFPDPHDLCEQQPDVILICTSIRSTESVVRALPLQRLRPSTLFVDVLSVKEFPKNMFLQLLPDHFDILCTHPMFGPDSGKHSWQDLLFVFDKVRIGEDDESRVARVDTFLDFFRKEGCTMVEMTCAEHDKYAAGSQFITHAIGRILQKVQLESTPINTRGYQSVLNLVENTTRDSFDLFYGLFAHNNNAIEQLERLVLAFESLKKELLGHLHDANKSNPIFRLERSRLTVGVTSVDRSECTSLLAVPKKPELNLDRSLYIY